MIVTESKGKPTDPANPPERAALMIRIGTHSIEMHERIGYAVKLCHGFLLANMLMHGNFGSFSMLSNDSLILPAGSRRHGQKFK